MRKEALRRLESGWNSGRELRRKADTLYYEIPEGGGGENPLRNPVEEVMSTLEITEEEARRDQQKLASHIINLKRKVIGSPPSKLHALGFLTGISLP